MPKKALVIAAKLGISASLLIYVFQDIDFRIVVTRLELMDSLPIVAAVLCLSVQLVVIGTWRWEVILRTLDNEVFRARLAQLVAIGIFFNQILPTTFGGDGLRIWMLSKGHTPLEVAVRSVVLDRLLGILALLILSLFSGLYLSLFYEHSKISVILGVLGFFLFIFILFFGLFLYLIKKEIIQFQKYFEFLNRSVDYILVHRFRLGQLIVISIAGHLLSFFAVWLAARAFAIEIPIWATLLAVPMIFLAAALPISIGGWGVREGGMIIALGMLGVSTSDATLVSITIGLIFALLGVMGGLVWAMTGFLIVDRRGSE